ncbi:hypothetical protein [Nocardia brasiliensis]|uniref:hypothetical protein n=1 Tax=Nocardia brasiliensis TaxID=37326 RepID=UPI0024581B01|nr:hypothetical protein [Nocardia brasiliensis]
MTLDRTGEPIPPQETCPYRCRRGGWLTPEDADVQRPCPIHRPRREPTGTDYNPANISERARAAIEKAERDE